MQALDDVQALRGRVFAGQTLLAASAIFDRPFQFSLDSSLDDAANHRSNQGQEDERLDAETARAASSMESKPASMVLLESDIRTFLEACKL